MSQNWDRWSPGEEAIYVGDEAHERHPSFDALSPNLLVNERYIVRSILESTPFLQCPVCKLGPQGIRVFERAPYGMFMWHCASEFRKPTIEEDKEEITIRELLDV